MATVDVDLPHVKDEDPHHHGPAKGLGRWLYTTNPQRHRINVSDL